MLRFALSALTMSALLTGPAQADSCRIQDRNGTVRLSGGPGCADRQQVDVRSYAPQEDRSSFAGPPQFRASDDIRINGRMRFGGEQRWR